MSWRSASDPGSPTLATSRAYREHPLQIRERTEGGAAELLQRLAHTYLGPDVRFPPMDDPPPGYITHIAVERIGGVGPWAGDHG